MRSEHLSNLQHFTSDQCLKMSPILCMLILVNLLYVPVIRAQNKFDAQQWTGAPGSDGTINTGDLNGDGKTDVFIWKDAIKSWSVNISTGTGFSSQTWTHAYGTIAPIYTGDLNADKKTDVFFWDNMEKVWRVNLSTGSSFLSKPWVGAWGSDGPINVGDLNGDGKDDVFMWRDGGKDWTVNISTGTGFITQIWHGAWGSDGDIHVGDLNGDSKDDVFMWNNSMRNWSVNLSTGTDFKGQAWNGEDGSAKQILLGDLNADKKTDVFMWQDAVGWLVNLSTGTGFDVKKWPGACKGNYSAKTGDFNGDNKTDVAIWKDDSKEWKINFSTGDGFVIKTYSGAMGSDGPINIADLNGDNKADIFMWNTGINSWNLNLTSQLSSSIAMETKSSLSDCYTQNNKEEAEKKQRKKNPTDTLKKLEQTVSGTRLQLNKIIYSNNESISARLFSTDIPLNVINPFIIIASDKGTDVEILKLIKDRNSDEGDYITERNIKIKTTLTREKTGINDGILSVQPGEIFYAIYYPKPKELIGKTKDPNLIFDIGIAEDKDVKTSPFLIIPELAMSTDEKDSVTGQIKIGTVLTDKAIPIQFPVNQVIYYPSSKKELNRFLKYSEGKIIGISSREEVFNIKNSTYYLVEVSPKKYNEGDFPQLRSLWGPKDKIYCSNNEVLKFMTFTFQCLIDGYAVAVNPRLQFDSDDMPLTYITNKPDEFKYDNIPSLSFPTENLTLSFTEPIFSIPSVWAFMALWDKDEMRIPLAVIDQGFRPNEDFRGYSTNSIHHCDIQSDIANSSGFISNCGPGTAEGNPTMGASLFGSKIWHGTGVVTAAGGMINNGMIGTLNSCAGTGGQVVVPMLYKYNISSCAFHVGESIKLAVDDGAIVINISEGYPCRLLTNIYGWSPGICTESERGDFCTRITAGLLGTATAICTFAPLIDGLTFGFGGEVACNAALLATTVASTACYSTILLGNLKGAMQDGIDYALERGVTIVASAGNDLSGRKSTPDIIKSILNLDPNYQRVETWEIIPASLPGVICVGAATNEIIHIDDKNTEDQNDDVTSIVNFKNVHFWGDRVDIWAPISINYIAPELDPNGNTSPSNTLVTPSIGGTSGASPYIAGLVADIQAINPSLNPKTPGLSSDQIKAIPSKILNLLKTTAYSSAELATMGYPDPDGNRRRNLVNPLRLIRKASLGVIPDYNSRGYTGSLNSDYWEIDGNDSPNPDAAYKLTSNLIATGSIINFPAEGANANIIEDVDFFYWEPPGIPGIYGNGFVELIFPIVPGCTGDLTINDDAENPISSVVIGNEIIKRYRISNIISSPECIGNNGTSKIYIKVSGKKINNNTIEDNIYKLKLIEPALVAPPPSPDRFDITGGNPNPLYNNNNNSTNASTPLGTGQQSWIYNALNQSLEISINELNFHSCIDEDWFTFNMPSDEQLRLLPSPFKCSNIFVQINFANNMDITFVESSKIQIFKNVSSHFVFKANQSFTFGLKPHQPGNPIEYNLVLSLKIGIDWACLFKTIPRMPPTPTWVDIFKNCIRCGGLLGTGIYEVMPQRPNSLANNFKFNKSDAFLLNWTGSGTFQIATKAMTGEINSAKIADRSGNIIGELRKMNNGYFYYVNEIMEPGVYMLIIEPTYSLEKIGYQDIKINTQIILPQKAIFDHSIPMEQFMRTNPFK